MIQRRLTFVTIFLIFSLLLKGADLKIHWHEGKDNLYKHPASLLVTDTEKNKAVAGAAIYRNGTLLGSTDAHGRLSTTNLNTAAVKYTLKATFGNKYSEDIPYQVQSSEYPYPAFVSMGEDPSVSMSFTWHTAESTKMSDVEYRKAGEAGDFQSGSANRISGESVVQQLIDVNQQDGKRFNVRIHKARIENLTPDTKYNYRIGDGKHWKEGSFLTAPAKGGQETFKFLFIADSQESSRENYQSVFKSVVAKAFEKNPDFRFIVHAGDMVNHGTYAQEWEWFYEAGEPWFSRMPFASLVGNHEAGGITDATPQQKNKAYLNFSNNPSNHTGLYAEGSAYSFNFGSAHLTCLDIQNLDDAMEINAKTGETKYLQSALGWLRRDLMQATKEKQWKIVTMHQPIYGANRDEEELRSVLAPIFDSCRVDLVITGHDHYYFRSFPMRYDKQHNDGEVVPMDQFGTIYIIGGSTSSKMYPQKFAKTYQAVVLAKALFPGRYPFLRNEPLTEQNYSTFTIKPEELHYQFFDRNGNLKDEVLLKRDSTK